jgi:4-hydroxy-3-methylbut-2-enyl diphosphate reductase
MASTSKPLTVVLARPRGFCAGVVRAIDIVERALELQGAPVYVRHEIVHNRRVVDDLRKKGAIFVDDVDEIPHGATTIFSAHGVGQSVEADAEARGLDVIDATCPLVRKVLNEGRGYAARGYDVVLIGHAGHAEVEGTRGQIDGRLHVIAAPGEVASLDVLDPERVAYITQTTLSLFDTQDVIAALKLRFPSIVGPDTRNICYATQNRQRAVLKLAKSVQLVLVVGSKNSSNANRLREIAESAGVASHRIDDATMIETGWLEGVDRIGLTAGASAPECLVLDVIAHLETLRLVEVELQPGSDERVYFKLPDRLTRVTPQAALTETQELTQTG